MLMKIHEFAKFCNVTNRALQLYDKMGLFVPAKVDESNGYRYYDTEQMAELNTISSFKQIGFTLNEIKQIKEHHFSKEDVIMMLKKKEKENSDNIEMLTYNNEIICSILGSLEDCDYSISEDEEARRVSKIARLDNDKLQQDWSKIIWL